MELEEAIKKLKKPKKVDLISLIRQFKREGIENFVVTKSDIIETVLKQLEQYKRLAEMNLKDSEEFQNNMCEHRCILYNEIEELKTELFEEKEKNNNLIKQLQEQNTEIQDISRQLRQEKEKNTSVVIQYEKVVDKLEEAETEKNKNTGKLVKNKIDGTIGIVLREWETGQVQVLENIQPKVINTHDSWETLEILEEK